MTREDAIKILNPATSFETLFGLTKEEGIKVVEEACLLAIADMEKQIQWEKTEKFNRMIEAFECDFSLIQQGDRTFAELDELMKDERYSLSEHMELMQELSYLIRHGKAEIWLKEGE